MRKFNLSSFATLASILIICFSGTLIFNACRKTDRAIVQEQTGETTPDENSGMNEKFFSAHNSTNPVVKAVQKFVLQQNDRYHFIDNLVSRIGLPYWDKALIFSNNQTGNNYRSSSVNSDSFNVVYIPFVKDTENFVNASLIVKMSEADTAFRLLSDWQYSQFGFNDTDTGWNARDIFHIFAKLDNNVFGTEKFRLTDENLLSAADKSALNNLGLPFDSVKIIYTFGSQPNNGRLAYAIQTEVCDPFSVCVDRSCPPIGSRQDQTFNNQSQGGCCAMMLIGEVCTTVWVEVGGSGGDGGTGGSGGGSSGGGGSGGWTPPPQCSGNPGARSSQVDPCSPGWVPVLPDNGGSPPPNEDPCTTAKNAAEKMDLIFTQSKADLVLNAIPNLATETLEKGFPIYRKFSVNPYNNTDTTFTAIYKPDDVQTGSSTHINILASIPYLHVLAATLHTHPPNGYTAHSADDIYSLISSRMNIDSHFEGSFVAASNGNQYVITITDYSKAAAFFATKSQYLNPATSNWNENTEIGKAFKKAYDYFENGNPDKRNYAYEMAMAAVLDEYDTGVILHKKDVNGNFKPLVVKTTTPNPNKPKKKVYTQDCL